ncbi:Hypothetical predicted protein [Paramuricea clavata]|uniref:Uncharacterized protein n=1 Tax=Paramuricea clavata TaxID=317549 RepID=A0A6S7I4T9_PARCT|nr:Hypothetical predicted protein [Paramuricea clavata]
MADYLESLAVKSSNGDGTAFMEIVKEFPCIYNRSNTQFKDKNLKSNAWKQIATLHEGEGVSVVCVDSCKQRYESIRTTFSRYLKKCKPPSGSGSDMVVLEPKYEHLRWLTSFIKSRSTSSNIKLNAVQINDASHAFIEEESEQLGLFDDIDDEITGEASHRHVYLNI